MFGAFLGWFEVYINSNQSRKGQNLRFRMVGLAPNFVGLYQFNVALPYAVAQRGKKSQYPLSLA